MVALLLNLITGDFFMAEQDTVVDPGAPLEPKKSGKGKKSAPGVEMDSAEVLLQVLEKATPEQRDRVSKYLGKSDDSLSKSRRRRRQQQSNAQIRQSVMSNGDVSHPDPNYLPDPPEKVSMKGQAAIDAWHEAWLNNKSMSDRDVAGLDQRAEEAQTFQAEMERRIDAGEFQATGI